jgi:hypothetical protein
MVVTNPEMYVQISEVIDISGGTVIKKYPLAEC